MSGAEVFFVGGLCRLNNGGDSACIDKRHAASDQRGGDARTLQIDVSDCRLRAFERDQHSIRVDGCGCADGGDLGLRQFVLQVFGLQVGGLAEEITRAEERATA